MDAILSGPAQPLIPAPFVVLGQFSERLPCLPLTMFRSLFQSLVVQMLGLAEPTSQRGQ